MRTEEEAKLFNLFVNSLRKKRGCFMNQVCEGLCTSQEISFLETGRRLPDKLLQDVIVERLGVGAEDYEHYLGYIEYERWKARQGILHNITFEEMEQAEKMLGEYYALYGREKDSGSNSIEWKLERQFYLSMLALIRRYNGASGKELYSLFDEAIHLTVPAFDHKPIAELILSIKELNLILEAEQYREEGERPLRYREVTEYIEKSGMDGRGMAKIYPKAVLFLCRSRMAEDQGEQEKADGLGAMYQENAEWKGMLEQIYKEFQVPKETFEYCYLYVMKGVACINDVIRIRRRMLGMKPGELCDGICDSKTLRRLERRQTVPRSAIVERLFDRLGLSGELTRTELVTDDPEARKLMEKMRGCENDQQWEAAKELLGQIKKRISLEIKSNKQTLLREEALLSWKSREIDNAEYCRQMQEALELTMPFEVFLKKGEKYLTYVEQNCIQNMLLGMDKTGEEFQICIERFEDIYRAVIDNGLQDAFSGMYEFIIGYVESELGDRSEYDQSDQYSEIIIRGCLRFRRLRALSDSLYNSWWNYTERKRKDISTDRILNGEEELYRCLLLSSLSKSKNDVIFYCGKLGQ